MDFNELQHNRASLSVTLCGLPIEKVSHTQALSLIIAQALRKKGGWVLTVNLDILRRWVLDDNFKHLTSPVSLRLADGMPLIWASRLQGQPLPERIAGSDLVISLSKKAEINGLAIYLLGGTPGVATKAAKALSQYCPGLRIAGTDCPAPGFENSSAGMSQVFERLHEARPNIVYVALGSPKQEELIARMQNYFPETWWLGVGGAFDFLAGKTRRAPSWMQHVGLEWFYRLAQEPRRLAHRYLVHDLPFVVRLFSSALARRLVD